MSSYSLPSSPEFSDEDNHPYDWPWYEPDWTPEQTGKVPVESRKRERSPSPPFIHHPNPARVERLAKLSPAKKERRLKKQLRLEKKEMKEWEKKGAKAFLDRIKRFCERSEERMREENLRALDKAEAAARAAEWRK